MGLVPLSKREFRWPGKPTSPRWKEHIQLNHRAALPYGLQPEYLESAGWVLRGLLMRTLAAEDRGRRLQKNLEIKPNRPYSRVPQVESNHVIEASSAPAFHLP
jgi:hypothetical protein